MKVLALGSISSHFLPIFTNKDCVANHNFVDNSICCTYIKSRKFPNNFALHYLILCPQLCSFLNLLQLDYQTYSLPTEIPTITPTDGEPVSFRLLASMSYLLGFFYLLFLTMCACTLNKDVNTHNCHSRANDGTDNSYT